MKSEDIDQALNPHRREEEQRAAEHTRDMLEQREVPLTGGESSDELADMLSAVETFEGAVRARGGDSFTNAPDSADPDNPALVLPHRENGERPADYIRRVLDAAGRVRSTAL